MATDGRSVVVAYDGSPDAQTALTWVVGKLERKLSPDVTKPAPKINVDEKTFRWMMNEDAMATEKLAEGIRAFAKDLGTLRAMVQKELQLAAA